MSLRRRLINLESIPPRRRRNVIAASEMEWLCVPLPSGHTDAERAHALGLMLAAQKFPREDLSGWLAVRKYAISLHRRYDGQYAGASEDFGT